jgi:hypothetical protein
MICSSSTTNTRALLGIGILWRFWAKLTVVCRFGSQLETQSLLRITSMSLLCRFHMGLLDCGSNRLEAAMTD